MSEISFWNQLVGSMAKIEYYLILLKCSMKKAVLYLLLVTFIISLLTGIQLSLKWNNAVDLIAVKIAANSPDFVFEHGQLTVDAPMPYVIDKSDDGLFIVDTSGKTDESVLKNYKKGMFIGKDKFVEKKNAVETRSYDFGEAGAFAFTKADVVKNMPWLKWFNILIVLCLFLLAIAANFTAALFVGACGLIASKIMSCKITFNELYKISIYALTLPLLLELARDLVNITIPLFRLWFYAIAIIYVIKVLKLLKNQPREETN